MTSNAEAGAEQKKGWPMMKTDAPEWAAVSVVLPAILT
jgi:hypothetical protein